MEQRQRLPWQADSACCRNGQSGETFSLGLAMGSFMVGK